MASTLTVGDLIKQGFIDSDMGEGVGVVNRLAMSHFKTALICDFNGLYTESVVHLPMIYVANELENCRGHRYEYGFTKTPR